MWDWLWQHAEALGTGIGLIAAFTAWLMKRERGDGVEHGKMSAKLDALIVAVGTLRDDARDDIGELRKAVARVETGLNTEREARDRAVIALRTELHRKRSITPQRNGRG